jgi:imidazole glycerol-phosphate synthase subunit HisF
MLKKRVIAVVTLRDGQVVQSVRFRHTNVIHYDAYHAVENFNRWAVDEIILIDISPARVPNSSVKSKNSTQNFLEILKRVSSTCFVPLTAGGWITTEEYAASLIANGADKLILNTVFHTDPNFVTRLAHRFGTQCIVGSIDIKRIESGTGIGVDRGRTYVPTPPGQWAQSMVSLGAGEVFFNSINFDGNRKGYDLEYLDCVCHSVDVPVIAFGGVFQWRHMAEAFDVGAAAVAAANIFHYKEHATKQAKRYLAARGYPIRTKGQVSYEVL